MFKRIIAASLLVAVLANAEDDYEWEGSSAENSAPQSSQTAPAASAPVDDDIPF